MSEQKRIAVAGAGAIGMLYSGLLARVAPGQVTLLTRRADAKTRLAEGVTVIDADGKALVGKPDIMTYEEALSRAQRFDVVIVAVAAYDNAAVGALIAQVLAPEGLCITVQNGLDNRAALAPALGAQRVLQGSTSFAVHQSDDGHVHINGPGVTSLQALPKAQSWLEPLLAQAGLAPGRIDDPELLAWTKIAGGSIGILCIILAAPAGKLSTLKSVANVADQALVETVRIARACGVALDLEQMRARQQASWSRLDENTRASLYSSFVAGRRTELDDRLGGLLRRAHEKGVATPVLGCLYELAQARLELAGIR